jgi:hypothetical protein
MDEDGGYEVVKVFTGPEASGQIHEETRMPDRRRSPADDRGRGVQAT